MEEGGSKHLRRNRPGQKLDEFFSWEAEDLDSMDTIFKVQQYLQRLIADHPHDVALLTKVPEGLDPALWQYEHLRQFTLELNYYVVRLNEVCTANVCPIMKATDEWHYLCAAHKEPKECCAIDYMIHTLDGAAAYLNSSKWFPSRLNVPKGARKSFGSVTRRLYRIFAHAYFNHRAVFDALENETRLCSRFTRFAVEFNLMTKNLLVVDVS
eukprot:TRINITY_DN4644_c0_g1_i1.p1 TRINITY_DN4644_c0_g1~~TRINITY_DN4644_c0_g1_i1.p1  ORF type:complete len:233 (+),score=36.79 TRINITY_DN4644_c0_g1_i1:69-701(+)